MKIIKHEQNETRIKSMDDPDKAVKISLVKVGRLLGETFDMLDVDAVALYVINSFPLFTPSQIVDAFIAAINGKLGEIDLSLYGRPLNALYVAKVLRAYEPIRQSQLKEIDIALPTECKEAKNREARRKMRIAFFEAYEAKDVDAANRLRYFDLLVAIEAIKPNSYEPFTQRAKAALIAEAMNRKNGTTIFKKDVQRLRDVEVNDDIEFKAKRLSVVDFVSRHPIALDELRKILKI